MGQGGVSATGGLSSAGGSTSAGGLANSADASGDWSASGPMDAPAAKPDGGPTDATASVLGDAYLPCAVSIVPSSSPSLFNLVPGDTATLAVKGTVTGSSTTVTASSWQWTVRGPDGTPLAITTVPTSERNTSSIQFPLLAPGIYDISVTATSSCKGHASATAVKPQERSQTYFLRVLPPPTSPPDSGQTCDNGPARWCPCEDAVPYEDNNFVLQAGQPVSHDVQLLRGYVVSVDPMAVAHPDPNAFPAIAVPSYIHLAPHGSTWTMDGASTSDQPMRALLHPLLRYDVLVVPQSSNTSPTALPPFRVASKLAQEFLPADFARPMVRWPTRGFSCVPPPPIPSHFPCLPRLGHLMPRAPTRCGPALARSSPSS